MVTFIQLAPTHITKPSRLVASTFKPGHPIHAQNCSYFCKMIINTLIDGKIFTEWFILIKLIWARNHPTQIFRNMILTRNVHTGGFASLQSKCPVWDSCTILISIHY